MYVPLFIGHAFQVFLFCCLCLVVFFYSGVIESFEVGSSDIKSIEYLFDLSITSQT